MAATQPETMVRLLQYLNISWSFNMLSKHLLWRKLLKMSWEKVTLLLREIKKQKTIPNFISRECRYHHSLPCFQQGLVCVCVCFPQQMCLCSAGCTREAYLQNQQLTRPFLQKHTLSNTALHTQTLSVFYFPRTLSFLSLSFHGKDDRQTGKRRE